MYLCFSWKCTLKIFKVSNIKYIFTFKFNINKAYILVINMILSLLFLYVIHLYHQSAYIICSSCTLKVLKSFFWNVFSLLSSTVPSPYHCRWAGLRVSSAVMGRSGALWVWSYGTSMQLLLPLVLCVTCIHGLFPPQPRVFLSFQGKNGSCQTPIKAFHFRWGLL